MIIKLEKYRVFLRFLSRKKPLLIIFLSAFAFVFQTFTISLIPSIFTCRNDSICRNLFQFIPNNNLLILFLALTIISLNLISASLRYFAYSIQFKLVSDYGSALTLKAFSNAFYNIHHKYYDDYQLGFTLLKQEGDIFVQQCLSYSFNIVSCLLILFIAVISLMIVSFKLFVTILLFFLTVTILFYRVKSKKVYSNATQLANLNKTLTNDILDFLRLSTQVVQRSMDGDVIAFIAPRLKNYRWRHLYNQLLSQQDKSIADILLAISAAIVALFTSLGFTHPELAVLFSIIAFRTLPVVNQFSTNLFGFISACQESSGFLKLYETKPQKHLVSSLSYEDSVNHQSTNSIIVSIKNLTLQSKVLYEDVNLSLPPSGLVLLKGPSGSGKSTFLRFICGALPSESYINNTLSFSNHFENGNSLSCLMHDQEPKMISSNINTSLTLNPNASLITNPLFLELVEYFSLTSAYNRCLNDPSAITMLSGGERVRFSLVRLFASNSKLLLIDEPTTMLDKVNTLKVVDLCKKYSKTSLLIVATHSTVFDTSSDHCLLVSNNKIIMS